MRKRLIIGFLIIAFLGILAGIGAYKIINKEERWKTAKLAEKKPENILETSMAEEIVISPNAIIKIETEYDECGHVINETIDVPEELVNKNEKEFRKIFDGWEIEKFSPNEIKIYKRETGNCQSHFIIKECEGMVCVFKIANNKEELIEKTKIAVEYLPELDYKKVKEGIQVVGIRELNSKLEDFE